MRLFLCVYVFVVGSLCACILAFLYIIKIIRQSVIYYVCMCNIFCFLVCICVCVYVCVFVCMCVSLYGYMARCCMYVCLYVYECMYVLHHYVRMSNGVVCFVV